MGPHRPRTGMEADDMTAYLKSLTGEQPRIVLPILPPSQPDTPRPQVKS